MSGSTLAWYMYYVAFSMAVVLATMTVKDLELALYSSESHYYIPGRCFSLGHCCYCFIFFIVVINIIVLYIHSNFFIIIMLLV